LRIVALEEHFTTIAIRQANAGHPLEDMYVHMAEAGMWQAATDMPPGLADLGDRRLADMDAAGIDLQVLSQNVPATESLNGSLAARLAREANDAVAEAVRAHPDRFAAFATLPMADPSAAADELERAVTDLGLCGAMVNGQVNGLYLDDASCWPVFERSEALHRPIYLHPTWPVQSVFDACYAGFTPVVSELLATAAWGWHVDTGLHVLRLILGGVFDRFPGLQVIVGHMGEALPSMVWRADWVLAPVNDLPRPIKDYFYDHVSITTSGVFDHAAFASALHAFGPDRIMFSVDYPYSPNQEGRAFLDSLPVSSGDREKIAYRNAERLLKLPRA
jgi:predicted TIM-barrel fold metal-dependent hydrolase